MFINANITVNPIIHQISTLAGVLSVTEGSTSYKMENDQLINISHDIKSKLQKRTGAIYSGNLNFISGNLSFFSGNPIFVSGNLILFVSGNLNFSFLEI